MTDDQKKRILLTIGLVGVLILNVVILGGYVYLWVTRPLGFLLFHFILVPLGVLAWKMSAPLLSKWF